MTYVFGLDGTATQSMVFADQSVLWWWAYNPFLGLLTAAYYRYSPSPFHKLIGQFSELSVVLCICLELYVYFVAVPMDRCYNGCTTQADAWAPVCCNDGNNPLSYTTAVFIWIGVGICILNAIRWIMAIVPQTGVLASIAAEIVGYNRFVLRRSLLSRNLPGDTLVNYEQLFMQSMIGKDVYLMPPRSMEHIAAVAASDRAKASLHKVVSTGTHPSKVKLLRMMDERNASSESKFLRLHYTHLRALKDPRAASVLSSGPITGMFLWAHVGYAAGWYFSVFFALANSGLILWHALATEWWEWLVIVVLDAAQITMYLSNVYGGDTSTLNILLAGVIQTRNVVHMRKWVSEYNTLDFDDGDDAGLLAKSAGSSMRSVTGVEMVTLRAGGDHKVEKVRTHARHLSRDKTTVSQYMRWFAEVIGELMDDEVMRKTHHMYGMNHAG